MTKMDLVRKYRGDYIMMMEGVESQGFRFTVCRRRVRIYYDESHTLVKELNPTPAQYAMMSAVIEVKAENKAASIIEAATKFWDSIERNILPPPQELIDKE